MAGQDVFKGALGWDDWVWWAIISGVGLLILLLLVCCCVCVQRAKRKGHEEALASVQRRQREAELRRAQQQQFALQQQQAVQTSAVAPNDPFGGSNNYTKPVNAVPLAPPPNRKNMGPQVAANGYLQPQQQQQPPFAPSPYQQQLYQQQYVQPQASYAQQQYGHYPPPASQQQYAVPAAAAYRAPPPPPQQHQEQFQKPYPPLPQQQQQRQQQQQQQAPAVQFHEPEKEVEAPPKPMKRRYHPPMRWYDALAANADGNAAKAAQDAQPLAANSPSSSSYHNAFAEDSAGAHDNSIDSIRYDPYGAQGNLNSAPFVSVTSPSSSSSSKKAPAKPTLAKTGNNAPSTAAQLPPPVVVATKYQSAPSMPAPSTASSDGRYGGPRGGSEVTGRSNGNNKYGTLADRIDALREGKVETMAHSRVSDLHDRDMPSPSSAISASAFASFSTNTSADRRAGAAGGGGDAVRRSGVLVGSVLSPSSSSTRSAGTSTSSSARRREHEKLVDDSFDAELLSSGAWSAASASQHDMSFGSSYSHGQFEDADDHTRSRKSDKRKALASRDSVEF